MIEKLMILTVILLGLVPVHAAASHLISIFEAVNAGLTLAPFAVNNAKLFAVATAEEVLLLFVMSVLDTADIKRAASRVDLSRAL